MSFFPLNEIVSFDEIIAVLVPLLRNIDHYRRSGKFIRFNLSDTTAGPGKFVLSHHFSAKRFPPKLINPISIKITE